jgi:predicted alpha/beta superfamily hydrolase
MTFTSSPAVILETRTHIVPSTVTGNDYELAVWLPPSYGTTDDRYPVLYLLDSPYAFGLAWASVCFRIWEGLMPETIVVGVGAPVQTFEDAFALYALLKRPALFQRHIATSPAVVFNGDAVVDLDHDAPAVGASLPASLFISVGALDEEYRASILAFTAALHRKNYVGLRMHFTELPNCAHASAGPGGFLAGLQATFPSPRL